jgi:hypothetical protein
MSDASDTTSGDAGGALSVPALRAAVAQEPNRRAAVQLLLQAKVNRLSKVARYLARDGDDTTAVDDELRDCQAWLQVLGAANFPPTSDDGPVLNAMADADASTAVAGAANGVLKAFNKLVAAYQPPSG